MISQTCWNCQKSVTWYFKHPGNCPHCLVRLGDGPKHQTLWKNVATGLQHLGEINQARNDLVKIEKQRIAILNLNEALRKIKAGEGTSRLDLERAVGNE